MTVKGINLIPDSIQRQWRVSKIRRWVVIGVSGYVCLAVALLALQFYALGKKKAELATAEAQKAALIAHSSEYSELSKKFQMIKQSENELAKRLSVASDLSGKRISWSTMLKKLSHDTPAGVWLRGISTSDEKETGEKKIRFLGSAMSNKSVAEFAFLLENSPYCKDVVLSYTQKRDIGSSTVYDFEIFASLKKTDEIMHEW